MITMGRDTFQGPGRRSSVHRSGREGVALLWGLFVAILLVGSTFLVTTLAQSTSRVSDVNRYRAEADYLGTGAGEHVANLIATSLRYGATPLGEGTITVDGADVDYVVELGAGPFEVESESGMDTTDFVYRITTTATVQGHQVTKRRQVVASVVPLFQFALFYESDMHFFYPAPMFINGPVHTNGAMYMYAHRGLTFDTNHMRAVDGVYMRPEFDEWLRQYNWGLNGPVTVRKWVSDPADRSEPAEYDDLLTAEALDDLGVASASGLDSDFKGWDDDQDGSYYGSDDWLPFLQDVVDRFGAPDFYNGGEGHTLLTGEHGIESVSAPPLENFDMFVADARGDYVYDATSETYVEVAPGTGDFAKGPLHALADLSIISYDDGSWKAFDVKGVEVTSTIRSVVRSETMYDARQAEGSGDRIDVTSIDLEALAAKGLFPKNGLLYVAGYGSGTGTDVKGFRLHKGASLAADLNVASPDSIYIHGDYNTDSPKSAAVMADAVNLLSNSWDNRKSPGTLPDAADTTYNVALITGDTAATAKRFNGGPHNLPRFHENWGGKQATITGSMVCLGTSRKATGTFAVNGDYYRAPRRVWSYDHRFDSIENLPPFTPVYVEVRNAVTW